MNEWMWHTTVTDIGWAFLHGIHQISLFFSVCLPEWVCKWWRFTRLLMSGETQQTNKSKATKSSLSANAQSAHHKLFFSRSLSLVPVEVWNMSVLWEEGRKEGDVAFVAFFPCLHSSSFFFLLLSPSFLSVCLWFESVSKSLDVRWSCIIWIFDHKQQEKAMSTVALFLSLGDVHCGTQDTRWLKQYMHPLVDVRSWLTQEPITGFSGHQTLEAQITHFPAASTRSMTRNDTEHRAGEEKRKIVSVARERKK